MNIQLIDKFFKQAGLKAEGSQLEQFLQYHDLIIENNHDNDLTRIKGDEQFIVKHFIDSILFTKFVQLPQSLMDIGTGAGFPGIPIKIMFPQIELILAEQRKRRIEFLKVAVKALGLTGVEFYPHKVTEKSFFNVAGVVTRALEDVPETLTRVSHFLPRGGTVTFLKGPDVDGDLKALKDENLRDFKLLADRGYELPHIGHGRRVLQFEKISERFSKVYKIMKIEGETPGTPIVSENNKTFKELKRAISGDGGGKNRSVVVSGRKIISDYIDKFGFGGVKLLLPDDYGENDPKFNEIIQGAESRGGLFILKKSLFNELDLAKARTPFLTAPMPELKEWKGDLLRGCNPMIPFQDPVNVGAAARSALAFGIERIVLLKGAASPFHPKAIRSSAGAVFSMEFLRGPSLDELLSEFPEHEKHFHSLDSKGADIEEADFPESFFIIPGMEGPGLPPELRQNSWSIPISGEVESLNASAALTVLFYRWSRKRKFACP